MLVASFIDLTGIPSGPVYSELDWNETSMSLGTLKLGIDLLFIVKLLFDFLEKKTISFNYKNSFKTNYTAEPCC